MFLNIFDRLVLELLNRFKGLFFRAGDAFFNFAILVEFVKYLFKVYDICLLPLIIL